MLTAFCGIKLLSFDCEYIHMFVDIEFLDDHMAGEREWESRGCSFFSLCSLLQGTYMVYAICNLKWRSVYIYLGYE